MGYRDTRDLVLQVAVELSRQGPGWAQQRTVLNEVAERIKGRARDEQTQQLILTCWHDLFRDGDLSWGLNIDNPDAPFYHVPDPEPERCPGRTHSTLHG